MFVGCGIDDNLMKMCKFLAHIHCSRLYTNLGKTLLSDLKLYTCRLMKARPLCRSGAINITFANELSHIVYLSNVMWGDRVRVPELARHRTRRKFSVRENAKAART